MHGVSHNRIRMVIQLWIAENWDFESEELSSIHMSLAVTHTDYAQYSEALLYYSKVLQLHSGNPREVIVVNNTQSE